MTDDSSEPDMARPALFINRAAPVRRTDLDETSWVDLVEGFIPEHEALLDHLLTTAEWKESLVWRYEKYLTEPRVGTHIRREDLPAAVRQAGLHIDSKYRQRFDGPAIIRYRDGRDSVAFHRDRAMRWLDETVIAIVVLGEPRPFVLRPHRSMRDDASQDVVFTPGRGDMLVMGGRSQADWMHAVPKVAHATDRVSLTWRWTSKSGPPDTSAPYNAARNFGDSGRVGPQRR